MFEAFPYSIDHVKERPMTPQEYQEARLDQIERDERERDIATALGLLRHPTMANWYRAYELQGTVVFETFEVRRTTKRGVWLKSEYDSEFDMSKKRANNWRFVLFDARKRYACPTKHEALVSFVARKKRQISILSSQMERARKIRTVADCMIHKGEY
jgi:hypothetical protein